MGRAAGRENHLHSPLSTKPGAFPTKSPLVIPVSATEAPPGATGLSKPVHVCKKQTLLYIYIFIYIYIIYIYIESSWEPGWQLRTYGNVQRGGEGARLARGAGGAGSGQFGCSRGGTRLVPPQEPSRGCQYLWKSLKNYKSPRKRDPWGRWGGSPAPGTLGVWLNRM